MRKLLVFTILSAVAVSCGTGRGGAVGDMDTLYAPRYAKGFCLLSAADGGSMLVVINPWQGARGVRMELFFPAGGRRPPEGFTGTTVRLPLRSVVCMSSTYVAFFDRLGRLDLVRGVSGGKFIYNPQIQKSLASGEVREAGRDTGINYELLAAMQPDLTLVYGVAGHSDLTGDKAAELGVKIAYIGDYLETTPLGRAEWIVAFGHLAGLRERAIEIFDSTEREYLNVKELTRNVTKRPEVMLNAPWRDTWFVPGDRNYMVSLINDAGGSYVCRGVDSDQSRPLSIESAYVLARKSDFWFNPGGRVATLAEALTDNPRFADIPPVMSNKVYNSNLRCTPEGGSDFWESGATHPELALKDLIAILHPELLPGHTLYYYRHLE
ncbi:MAG: ABC transporter substrate-binding protein [Rikenellaceae bacterium]|jgi:iron complex transport system substrate-binding protein|nr:ABC transporter substrate-binding protein [Rikenellaceae bacterium]